MKNLKAMSFATLALASLTLGACGAKNTEVKTKGVYLSPAVMSYSNMRPTYNYYLTTFTQEELTLFENNTYCLIVSSSQFSAVVLDENTNDFSGNERSNYLYKFYGDCSSKANDIDVLICDTAGRLQNKVNLMKELEKMSKVISREYPEAARENLLVLDATTGKNAVSQAEEFSTVSDITGIVLTKMDGTARGGISITITDEYDMPIKFIGVGETMDDLEPFNAHDFVEGIFDE